MPELSYDEQREVNIALARAKLVALGIAPLLATNKPQKKRKADPSKKRGVPREEPTSDGRENADEPPKKAAKIQREDGNAEGLRRSARNRGKDTNYADNGENATAAARALPQVVSASARRSGMMGAPREAMNRKHDPKTYGSIPDIPVGSWWETREACSKDAIHAPWVAGIAPGPKGAYSVALSGGYEDDIDEGEAFTFTGSGMLFGTKDKPKNLRTAPQSRDQTFENNFNASLKRSCETKKPVRVIRGYKLDSVYGPVEGYRYDGLYTVEDRELRDPEKRVPGQPPLQTAEDGDNEEDIGDDDDKENAH
ncbi:hypothetical protein GSI_06692 [Ganoderma sinense ZZ0214-1]|uniref:YDG domain-containing protein n=1 Tax=Ganoderma sinense ZZ0214-1 TaxID=1077348 RepID=A0A2G8SEI3_9APHY|nr:hypothetical protein GSI_06692 [Ganoderma sinense ZZ0214-1]